MQVKIIIDHNASSSKKSDALSKIIRELGSKATVSGDVIKVDTYDEGKVTKILSGASLNYSRST
jgi:hypothetical protein